MGSALRRAGADARRQARRSGLHRRRPRARARGGGALCRQGRSDAVTIEQATPSDIDELTAWQYGPPYELYDGDYKPPLNPERFFVEHDADGRVFGFFYFEE